MLDAERLGRRDLHVVDVAAVPDRFEDAVGEAKDEDVLHRLLGQVVVDAVYLPLVEGRAHHGVQRPGAFEVAAERLFDDDPHPAPVLAVLVGRAGGAALLQPGGAEALDDHREQTGRSGQVEDPVAAGALGAVELGQRVGETPVALRVVELALYVVHVAEHVVAGARLGRAGAEEAVDGLVGQPMHLLVAQRLAPVADQREAARQDVVAGQVVERRDELATGEIAGHAEQHDDARLGPVAERQRRRQRAGVGRGVQRRARLVVADLVHAQATLSSTGPAGVIWPSPRGRRTRCAARPGPCPRTSRADESGSGRTATAR